MGEGWRKEGGRLPRVDFIITECRLFYAPSASSRFFSSSFSTASTTSSFYPPRLTLSPRYVAAPSADIHVVVLALAKQHYAPCRRFPLLISSLSYILSYILKLIGSLKWLCAFYAWKYVEFLHRRY